MEELVEFVNDTVDDEEITFVDMPEDAPKKRITDDEVWQQIELLTKIKDPTSFQQLSKDKQQAILHSLRVKGASISQLQRITGLGKGFIQRT